MGEIENQERMDHEEACTQLFMPTIEDFQANSTDAWTIDSSQVECLVNQSCSKLPPNVSGEKRDKWTLSKLYNFREWADRDTCSAVCDAAFAFRSDDSSQEPTKLFKFSLSYIYSKADFFTAVGQWPPGQSNKPPMQITYVEDETTTDPRVLEIIIFWIYTDVLLDVHTLTNGSCKAEDLLALPDQYFLVTKPTIMADMLDVYKVAFMFGMNRLMKKIRKHCFKPSMGCCFQATENKLACLLARCGTTDAEGDVLLHIADSYVKFARGIPCLCRWPLMYSQKKWEILMEAGKSFSHHWFAHVVPLYIHIFMPSASCAEVIALADKYNLDEAAKKSIAMHLQASDMRSSLEFNGLGTFCMERQTSIPHVRSLQRFYKVHYNIDLAEGMGPSKSWVLPWAHMLAACAQIHSTVQEEKLAEISPDWLGKVCMSVLDRYGKTAENEQEEADVCVKRLWLVDRMVLGPLHDTSSVSAFDLAEYACRDMVVLQVTTCINKIARRMGGLRDLSSPSDREKLPLYYIPQILDAVCDGLSISAHAKTGGFTVKVQQSKRRKVSDDSNSNDLAHSMDGNRVLGSRPASSFCGSSPPVSQSNKPMSFLQVTDCGSLW